MLKYPDLDNLSTLANYLFVHASSYKGKHTIYLSIYLSTYLLVSNMRRAGPSNLVQINAQL